MKKILLSTLLASLLVTGSFAKETTTEKNNALKQMNTTSINKAIRNANNNNEKLAQEAIDSLKYAHDALHALHKENKKEALSYLGKALGKLEVTLASKNVPELLPVDNIITIEELIVDSKTIKEAINLAKNLLDENKIQAAKEILEPLKSEIRFATVNLPLAAYPLALKETVKLINEEKIAEAKIALGTALNTLVEVETIIPIPLLMATELIGTAADSVEKDTEKAKTYLDAAKEELNIAKYLGYISKSDVTYKTLEDAIDELKSEITSTKIKSLFTEAQNKIKDFTSKIFSSENKIK